ncbi:MAG: hypothetical protein WAJ85_13190 [Candidatus Baltobacteraceae bacterium]
MRDHGQNAGGQERFVNRSSPWRQSFAHEEHRRHVAQIESLPADRIAA